MIACIPTKGRPNTNTYVRFEQAGIKCYHFLEPQEYKSSPLPNKVSIKQNDRGVSYARNFILEWAKANNQEWIVMCDDDVNQFGYYKNNQDNKVGAVIWHDIKRKAERLPFELYGVNLRQHAWYEKKDYTINKSFVEVCLLMHVPRIHWHYRSQFDLKEDRDFVLQTIKKGNGIIKFHKHYYNCPAVGSNAGGLQGAYASQRDKEAAIKMCYEYAPHAKMHRKDNRIDVKIDIASYAKQNNRIVK